MLKQKLQSWLNKVQIAIVKWQLGWADDHQRQIVDSVITMSTMRVAAQEDFDKRSKLIAAHKKVLQTRLRMLQQRAGIPETHQEEAAAAPDYVLALRLAAGQATCCHVELADDPLDWPLPCDVDIGPCTIRRGVSLRTLVTRMQALHAMAAQAFPAAANMTLDPARSQAELHKPLI